MTNRPVKSDTYWANNPPLDCALELQRRIHDYYLQVTSNGLWNLWCASYGYYYTSLGINLFLPGLTGVSNQPGSLMTVNHYKSLADTILNMTVNQRPSFEPRAVNSDHKSQVQTLLARGLLDYYMREKSLETYLREAVHYGLLFGEGYVLSEWDQHTGEPVGKDPDTGEVLRTGDLVYSTATPLDVARDLRIPDPEKSQWYCVRRLKNKFDLAARYPELADKIIGWADNHNSIGQYMSLLTNPQALAQSDLCITYTLYHDRTPACPDGRYMEMLDPTIILIDGPLPYKSMPVKRLLAGKLDYTPFGYTIMYDLMSLQDCVNGLYSTVKTNQETFGVQNILAPRGSGLSVDQLTGNLNFIEYDASGPAGVAGKPEALNLTQTPAEIFNFLEKTEKAMETLSGVNSVVRGDPQASLKSGAALALVQSQAIQFSYGLQFSYTKLLEDVGQSTIDTLRTYASVPRIAAIVGKNGQSELKEFTGDDLAMVNRVLVDQGNPLSRTTAGKVELATMMIQNKLINTPDELLQVIQTGNIEPLTEGKTSELLAIKQENELLADGQTATVLVTDNHALHINEHKSVLSDPRARDPNSQEAAQIIQATLEHISEHVRFLTDPASSLLLQLIGQQPVPQAQPANPGQQAALGAGVPAPPVTAQATAELPDMPQQPVNPLTKERYVPPKGPQQ